MIFSTCSGLIMAAIAFEPRGFVRSLVARCHRSLGQATELVGRQATRRVLFNSVRSPVELP